jgi:archaeal flagellar protein FlaJ
MEFKIPFTFSDTIKLKKRSSFFISRVKPKKKADENFKKLEFGLTREEYLGICNRSFVINFFSLFVLSNIILFFLSINIYYIYSFGIAILFSGFVFFSQMMYPRIYMSRKQKEIEKNLLPALEDISIQLNSGISIFNIMVNISGGDYGALSEEFKKAVKKINAGVPESEALNYLGKLNSSVFFRRTLWQMSNGMNAGSDMGIVIKDSIKALEEEQSIQLQNYGSSLNPLMVLYMLIAIIVPALSVTFLTVISSMVNLDATMTQMIFVSLYVFDILFQIMFLGMIRSRRPSLL